MTNGNVDPSPILIATIDTRDTVIATVSAGGVENTAALINPVKPSIKLKHRAITPSRRRKFDCVLELRLPTARPRMTKRRKWVT